MFPKFILFSTPDRPMQGMFLYGLVANHKDLIPGYGKVHGGGWYEKDDAAKTMTLYGSSGDYGEPVLSFLNWIPRELREYTFIFTPVKGLPGNPLDLSEVIWF